MAKRVGNVLPEYWDAHNIVLREGNFEREMPEGLVEIDLSVFVGIEDVFIRE